MFTTHSPLLLSRYYNIRKFQLDNGILNEINADLYYKDLDNITLNKMFLLASKISDEIMQKLNKKGISLQFNYGDTQVVKHVHLHLIPNYELEKDNMDINEVYHLLKN